MLKIKLVFFYVFDDTHFSHNSNWDTKKIIKLFRNSSIETKVEIVTSLLRPTLDKDKAN